MIKYYFISHLNTQEPIKNEISARSLKTIADFKEYISDLHDTTPPRIQIYEVYNHKIYRYFHDLDTMGSISPYDNIIVYELQNEKETLLLPIDFTFCENPIEEAVPFAYPFLVRITSKTPHSYIFDLVQKLLKRHLKDKNHLLDYKKSVIIENVFHYSASIVLTNSDEPILNELNFKSKNTIRVQFKKSYYEEIFKLDSFIQFQ